jgi:hypothetical protein
MAFEGNDRAVAASGGEPFKRSRAAFGKAKLLSVLPP